MNLLFCCTQLLFGIRPHLYGITQLLVLTHTLFFYYRHGLIQYITPTRRRMRHTHNHHVGQGMQIAISRAMCSRVDCRNIRHIANRKDWKNERLKDWKTENVFYPPVNDLHECFFICIRTHESVLKFVSPTCKNAYITHYPHYPTHLFSIYASGRTPTAYRLWSPYSHTHGTYHASRNTPLSVFYQAIPGHQPA